MEKINRRIDLIEDKDERKQQTVDEIRNANELLKNDFKELKQEKETHLIDFAEHLNSLENKLNKLKEKVAQDSQNNQTLHSSIYLVSRPGSARKPRDQEGQGCLFQ